MGTSNSDLIQSNADNWQQSNWTMYAYTLMETSATTQEPIYGDGQADGTKGDKVTMHFRWLDRQLHLDRSDQRQDRLHPLHQRWQGLGLGKRCRVCRGQLATLSVLTLVHGYCQRVPFHGWNMRRSGRNGTCF
ncbi:uncharacterized protein AKAW2_50402S [Aspergillus luchuensis]|uniref:Uncharacterized protein n=1 Tax=Aspergillus kawachii TaxID=1069201 RepID=A0A7R7WBT6_ASPKA|nr:uncharacterized protein AKAW2_50402S [Aspergillus luchuensis]BCS00061.1 hypothetical protein AKAW2_50402S [Aspergillus luchuensis]